VTEQDCVSVSESSVTEVTNVESSLEAVKTVYPIETGETDVSLDTLDKLFNILSDLLVNHMPDLSQPQAKFFFAVLVGTLVVKLNKINNTSAKSNQSAKYSNSFKDVILSPLNPGFFNTDLRVHMLSRIGVDHPHLTVDEAGMASIRNGRSQY